MSKIEDVYIKYYSLAFKKPFNMINSVLNQKKGFLLLIKTDEGMKAGDCSPLLNYSIESFQDAQEQMLEIYDLLNKYKGKDLEYSIDNICSNNELVASVEHCLKSCLIEDNSSQSRRKDIEVNALINCSLAEVEQQLEIKYNEGYRIFKIKLGRKDFSEELEFWKRFKFKEQKQIKYIFDPNRSWTYNQFYSFAEVICSKQLLYFEDPLAKEKELEIALKEERIPIALDESLDIFYKRTDLKLPFAVIKPTIQKNYVEKIKYLNANGTEIVLSSAFESSLGIKKFVLITFFSEVGFPYWC